MPTPYINGPQCTAMLKNQMRCIRKAVKRKPGDLEDKESLCEICWRIQGAPVGFEDIPYETSELGANSAPGTEIPRA